MPLSYGGLVCSVLSRVERAMEVNSPISFSPWRRLYLLWRRKERMARNERPKRPKEDTEGKYRNGTEPMTFVTSLLSELSSQRVYLNVLNFSIQTGSFIPYLSLRIWQCQCLYWSAFDMQLDLNMTTQYGTWCWSCPFTPVHFSAYNPTRLHCITYS